MSQKKKNNAHLIKDKSVTAVNKPQNLLKKKSKNTAMTPSESTKIYRDLVENAAVGLSQTTFDGKHIYVNDAMRKIMEFDSAAELAGTNVSER